MNKNNGFTVIAAALIVSVAIAVGGGYTYYKYPDVVSKKVKSIFTGAPEDTDAYIAESFENLAEATSFKISGESTVRAAPSEAQKAGIPVSDATMKWDGAINLVTLSFSTIVSFDASQYKVGFEMRKIGQNLYVRTNSASKEFSAFIGQWISLDLTTAGKQYDQEKVTQRIQKIDNPTVRDFFTKAVEYKVFKAAQEFPEEEVAEVLTRHFSVGFDKLALEKLVKEMSGELDANEEAQLQQSLIMLDSYVTEVWIGKRDHMPRKLTIRSSGDQSVATEVSAIIMFSEFNKPVNVEQPSGAVSLEDFLKSSLQKAFPKGAEINIER